MNFLLPIPFYFRRLVPTRHGRLRTHAVFEYVHQTPHCVTGIGTETTQTDGFCYRLAVRWAVARGMSLDFLLNFWQ